jgi:hypothetical protein
MWDNIFPRSGKNLRMFSLGLKAYDLGDYQDNCKKIPIYFITAISGSEVEDFLGLEDEDFLNETNSDVYILKPFNLEDFEIILDLLNYSKPEMQEA